MFDARSGIVLSGIDIEITRLGDGDSTTKTIPPRALTVRQEHHATRYDQTIFHRIMSTAEALLISRLTSGSKVLAFYITAMDVYWLLVLFFFVRLSAFQIITTLSRMLIIGIGYTNLPLQAKKGRVSVV